jgi:hypothetical protein
MPKGKPRSRRNSGRGNPARNPVGDPRSHTPPLPVLSRSSNRRSTNRRSTNRHSTNRHSTNRRLSIRHLANHRSANHHSDNGNLGNHHSRNRHSANHHLGNHHSLSRANGAVAAAAAAGIRWAPSSAAVLSAPVSNGRNNASAASAGIRFAQPFRPPVPSAAGVNWSRGVAPEVSRAMRPAAAGVGVDWASGVPPVSSAVLRARMVGPREASAQLMTAKNLPIVYGEEVVDADPIGHAELNAVMEGYYDALKKEKQGSPEGNLPRAIALKSHRPSRRAGGLGNIWDKYQHSMRTGSLRQINKNGSRVLVGETNPMLSTRSTIDMLDEVRAIMAAEGVTQTDLARVDQLLRMARIRNEQLAQEVRSERAQVQAEGLREEIAYLFHRLRDRVQRLSQRASSTLGNLWHRATRRSPNDP